MSDQIKDVYKRQQFSQIKEVRGEGLMIGMEFEEPIKELRQRLLFEQKVFTGVSGLSLIHIYID